MKCRICGGEAPYFIETYLLKPDRKKTLYYCKKHLIIANFVLIEMEVRLTKKVDE